MQNFHRGEGTTTRGGIEKKKKKDRVLRSACITFAQVLLGSPPFKASLRKDLIQFEFYEHIDILVYIYLYNTSRYFLLTKITVLIFYLLTFYPPYIYFTSFGEMFVFLFYGLLISSRLNASIFFGIFIEKRFSVTKLARSRRRSDCGLRSDKRPRASVCKS